ncbi:MAG: hypothetical protein WBB79_04135, partial [Candidatus Macondimonas sp.]
MAQAKVGLAILCAVSVVEWLARRDLVQTGFLLPVLLAWLAFALVGGESLIHSAIRRARDRWRDAAIVGALAWAADPGATLWAVPANLAEVLSLTQGAAAAVAGGFMFASLLVRMRHQAPLSHA